MIARAPPGRQGAAPGAPGALGHADTVFCDSLAALEQARAHGLPPGARILSVAPSVILRAREAVSLEDRVPPETYEAFFGGSQAFAERVHGAARQTAALGSLALLLARIASTHQRWMIKAAALREEDFDAPRTVLEIDTGAAGRNDRFNSYWPQLLRANPGLHVVRYPVQPTTERDGAGGQPPRLVDRIRFASWESLAYRVAVRVGSRRPRALTRGRVLVVSEGELLKETCCYLALRGYSVERARVDTATPLPDDAVHDALLGTVAPVLRERMAGLAPARAVAAVVEACLDAMGRAAAGYRAAEAGWHEALRDRVRAVLATYVDGPGPLALAAVCRARRIPFFSFQHGLGRELVSAYDGYGAHLENSVAPHFLTFNTRSAEVSRRNPFACRPADGATIDAIGFSREHRSVASEGRHAADAAPILYISTAVYRGYLSNRVDPVTDIAMAREERALVSEVLARLPHEVAFKPYPTLRYTDPDPVLATARAASNISLVGEHIDLRYMIRRHRVNVMMRATSTVGWCLFSEKPLVFVDAPHWFEMREEARHLFRQATFYFDVTAAGWMDDMRDLLARPVASLESEWRARRAERRALMALIDDQGSGAGRRGARIVLAHIDAAPA